MVEFVDIVWCDTLSFLGEYLGPKNVLSSSYFMIVSRLGWYVDVGALIRVTYDRSLLNMFQE